MADLPGTSVSQRPLHFYWVADCSGSMGIDGKIQALNVAIREALPHMCDAASLNPGAKVLVRAMRFSSGARWIDSSLVLLESYRWNTQAADDLPRTAAFAAEFRDRLLREGAQTGDVQAALKWDNYNDLDLHVDCPNGHHIYFADKRCACGGWLDVDMNVSPTSQAPIENVFFPTGGAPTGRYKVSVNHYRNHGLQGCADPTIYRVALKIGAEVREFSGSVSHGQTKLVHEFALDSSALQAAAGASGGGNTDVGAALRLLKDELGANMPGRGYPPVVVLLSDGQPTDDFEAGLRDLLSVPWGRKAVRMAIAIGSDADMGMLETFAGSIERPVMRANNANELIHYIRWYSTNAIAMSSRAHNAGGAGQARGTIVIPAPDPAVAPGQREPVW